VMDFFALQHLLLLQVMGFCRPVLFAGLHVSAVICFDVM
jgi:hypothetical protein